MAIFSEPNSFYQLNNDINYGCIDADYPCLPIADITDIAGLRFFTDNDPIVPEDQEGNANYPLISYSYRIVSKCSEPIISSDIIKHYTELKYKFDVVTNQWALTIYKLPNIVFVGFDLLECNKCFFIQIIKTVRSENPDQETEFDPFIYSNLVVGCVGCFVRVCGDCYTTRVKYSNNENAFGFNYNSGFFNSIRLPLYLKQPQFPTTRNVFTLSNGSKKKLSSRIEKEWTVETDWMPKEWHEKLVIALEHDYVQIENVNANLNSDVIMESNYQIEWEDFLHHPTAKANFKLKQIPYNNINSNCS